MGRMCLFLHLLVFRAILFKGNIFQRANGNNISYIHIPQCSKNLKKCGLWNTYLLHQTTFFEKNYNVPNTHPKCACLAKTKFQKKLT